VRAWHWFDRVKVLRNLKNHLMEHGLLLVVNSIFVPDSDVAKLTFEVLRDHHIDLKPAGANAEVRKRRNGFPVNWFDEWEEHLFGVVDEWQEHYTLPFTPDAWCGKIRSVSWMTNADEL